MFDWNMLPGLFLAVCIGGAAGRMWGVGRQRRWRRSLAWRHRMREYGMTQRMREMSRCLHHLSYSFRDDLEKSYARMSREEAAAALTNTAEQVCGACGRCHASQLAIQKDAYYLQYLTAAYRKNGAVRREDMPQLFAETCRESGIYIERLNREMERNQSQTDWKRRYLESRQVAGEELLELERFLLRMADSLDKPTDVTDRWNRKLAETCRGLHLDYQRGMIWEQENGRLEMLLQIQARGRRCVPARSVAAAVGRAVGRELRPVDGSRTIVHGELCSLELEEAPAYEFEAGVARCPAKGSEISGDNFSALCLPDGKVILCLSDGMGSGRQAWAESDQVVELCEHLMEAGISLSTSARMINTALVLRQGEQRPATLDLHRIDLYSGEMESLKRGTPPTFLWQKDGIHCLESGQSPIGWAETVTEEAVSTKFAGDMAVVLLTDGVLEAFPGEDKEEFLTAVLSRMSPSKPQDAADALLALARGSEPPRDDLTVVVAAFQRRSAE
ncbi:MAG: SpoIIE family protein phosphatase [Lachnospiraceae bacterium]|nr:SpoIIE family protein phosphatase [Lachnospiraceae bacterium]